ncbi:hypothetical protein MFMK1_001517 [Metallumcola ferriviriculae]|uniref:Uncharacterized protein n=1 Tax=Metallumcola ferriviriculae TaxID=3039180 RepID=A0AAU0UN29_9FIRM|nr:hypothetical protein MFMK1_001517 [Desulfitibacteraceae bacterium MK1]
MDSREIKLKRDHPEKPKEFFTFDLGEKMENRIVLPEEKISPWEVLTEEVTWDPGVSD